MEKAYIVLEDGTVFEGRRIGARADCVGELVFTTNMCGYIETLTDPSYYGQIVLQTFPLIGNYGIIPQDFEGECCLKGYVVRECCASPSNFRAVQDLDSFLQEKGIPGVCGVDTRELTGIIREHGVMNASICAQVPEKLDRIRAYRVQDAVKSVTTAQKQVLVPEHPRFQVALMDYGAKRNIIRELLKRDCQVTVLPAGTRAGEILAAGPDGVMLSNGPGDPQENTGCIAEIQKLMGKTAVFGICLGHQLMALANGGETVKLKYGHRGGNQPVRDLAGPRTYITSQNHGYAVSPEKLRGGQVRYINVNDGTCEGIDYPTLRAFSVQFHPEACAGPQDTAFLFDRFIALMEGKDYAG